MNEVDIQSFWNSHPCGDTLVGGLQQEFSGDYLEFFDRYDAHRYSLEGHILACLDAIHFRDKKVLEIGLGQGADSEQLVRRGARWSGVDLTPESIERVRTRFLLKNLPLDELKRGSALDLPFADHSFDIVFSHGVLHHIPDIRKAQSEIARVLKPGGELIMMMYAKWSLNYLLAISLVRRLALAVTYASGRDPGGIVGQHLALARQAGLGNYLRIENFIHRNTDGPLNPYAKVYDRSTIERDFPAFLLTRTYRRFMHAPPLPVRWLPLERALGWHLWAHLKPKHD